jgi:anti-sigma B factor antagonist
MGASLSLRVTGIQGGHLVTASGDIDLATAADLAEHLGQFANGAVHLDLSGVDFLDSVGMSVLVDAHRRLNERGSQLIIHGSSPMATRVFEITHLNQCLDLDGLSPGGAIASQDAVPTG